MADKDTLNKYQPTIGMECHVQLNTKTKLFARVDNDAREAQPNTTVSAICFGLPGVLPYLNQAAVDLAIKAGLALNARINTYSKFDRKHYFYPDLPKGYQITQYDQPIIGQGFVNVPIDGQTVKIGIERAHLEEDAGKLTHPGNADYSLVDLNRAGTPLLEIVSQPDIKSPAIAKAYARELYLLMKYAGVSDVDLYHGHMRFDVNISVAKKGSAELGTRAEVKNLNSFKAVEKAAQYEYERQVELLEKNEKIVQETRGWHDDKQKTFSQRGKEEAHDYRYFPEPDLPPVELTESQIEQAKSVQNRLPAHWRSRLADINLDQTAIEGLLDAEIEDSRVSYLDLFEELSKDTAKAKNYANWVVNVFIPAQRETGKFITDSKEILRLVGAVHSLLLEEKINSNNAYQLLRELAVTELPEDIEQYANNNGYIQVSDSDQITTIAADVIANNPKAASDYKAGESKAIGFLTGQVMKASHGRANPKIVQDILKKQLEN